MGKNKYKHTRINKDDGNTKEVIDLTDFMKPSMVSLDENGSYTGITKDTYYYNELEEPIQDADDL